MAEVRATLFSTQELGLMPQSEADFNAFMWHWAELFDSEAW